MASLASVHPQSCPYTPLSNRRGFVDSGHQIEKLEFALAVAVGRGDQQRIHELRQRIADLGDKAEPDAKAEVEAGIAALKEALEGDDIEAIAAKSAELSQSMMKMGEAAYQAEQAAGEAGDTGQADGDDTVVDADFEEVDDAAAGDKK